MLFLLLGNMRRGEIVGHHKGVHPLAQIVEILFVHRENDVHVGVREAARRRTVGSANTPVETQKGMTFFLI